MFLPTLIADIGRRPNVGGKTYPKKGDSKKALSRTQSSPDYDYSGKLETDAPLFRRRDTGSWALH